MTTFLSIFIVLVVVVLAIVVLFAILRGGSNQDTKGSA